MSADEAKAVVRAYWEHGLPGALKGDPHALKEHLADDFVVHTDAHTRAGEGGVDDHYRALTEVTRAIPDVTPQVHRYIAEGDLVVAHWRLSGRHGGHHTHRLADGQLAPTQAPLEVTGITIYRVENGRIAEMWNHDNHIEALIAAGALKVTG